MTQSRNAEVKIRIFHESNIVLLPGSNSLGFAKGWTTVILCFHVVNST